MSEQNIKQNLTETEFYERKRWSEIKYETKKKLDKFRSGGYKRTPRFTEEELVKLIEECNTHLDTRGSRGRTKFVFDYPRLENNLDIIMA